MGRVHLCRQKQSEVWYILEEDVDYIGAMHNGIVGIMGTDDVIQADSITGLLHKLHDSGDTRWYVVPDFIDSKRESRHRYSPHHRMLHVLSDFSDETCDIRQGKAYGAAWEIRFIDELWFEKDSETLIKVRYFDTKMRKAAEDYIKERRLIYEDEKR